MKRDNYIKPVAEVIRPNCNGDILDDVQFRYSNTNYATDGGRAKEFSTFDDNNQQDIYAPFKKDLWADDDSE